jgi:hypothetical protein
VLWIVPRRNNLQNPKAISCVGDEGEYAAGDHSDFHVVGIVNHAVRIVFLVVARLFRILDVNKRQAKSSVGNIGVGSRHAHISRITERNLPFLEQLWARQIRHVQPFQSIAVHNEGIAELYGDSARIVEFWRADGRGDARCERMVGLALLLVGCGSGSSAPGSPPPVATVEARQIPDVEKNVRADQISINGVRLPYFEFPRNPTD